MILNNSSNSRLEGVHPDLVRVVKLAAHYTEHDFIITEGLRTVERQKILFSKGLSKTMNSRHITGHAIDFAPVVDGEITWKWPAFGPIAGVFKRAAAELKIPIEWGGEWKSFKDGPHIQLSRKQYP
jgi:peptidoglycan L-alanyl-D-glutamate endopeptidase CwlK